MSVQEESSNVVLDALENSIEWIVFNSRWLLAPLYLGLITALVMVLWDFADKFYLAMDEMIRTGPSAATVAVLELLDVVLLANLVILVIFVGYENFVSKIGVSEGHEDRPKWLGSLGFSGMKLKLIGSIVAISMIELLRDFIAPADPNYHNEQWRIALHMVFVVSGLIFAISDVVASKAEDAE